MVLETENVFSDDYVLLGLKEKNRENLGKPRVLSLLSLYLEKSVQINERKLESAQIKDVITIFHGLRAPSLSIQQYVDRIFKYSCCSPACFVIAHIYMDRFIQCTGLCLTSLSIHRLLVTAVMLAAKFMDDSFFNNAYYARVGGVSTAELNKLEKKFLFGIDFRLYVSMQTFGAYCSLLKKEATGRLAGRSIQVCGETDRLAGRSIQVCGESDRLAGRSIQVCGETDSKATKDDSARSKSIAR